MKWWIVITLVGALGVGGCSNPVRERFESVAQEQPKTLTAARQAGIWLSRDALRSAPVPDEENAFLAPRAAAAELKEAQGTGPTVQKNWIPTLRKSDPKSIRQVADALAPLDPALDALVEATRKPGWSVDWTWLADGSPDFEAMTMLSNAVSGLSSRGLSRARLGQTEAAIADWSSALSLIHRIGSEPFVILALMQWSQSFKLWTYIEWAVTARAKDAFFLAKLDEFLKDQPRTPNPLRSIQGESILGLSVMNDPLSYTREKLEEMLISEEDQAKILPKGVSPQLLARAYSTQYLKLFVDVWTQIPQEKDLFRQMKLAESIEKKYSDPTDPTLAMMNEVLPLVSASFLSACRSVAKRRSLQGLVAAMQYRLQNGTFPSDLSKAGFTDPDPFGGQPLRFWREGDSIRVYSVGEDLIDVPVGSSRPPSPYLDYGATYPSPR